ncbi:MAG TPA: HD domain-containing phosphohydrolase [Longimicrobium sp.]
MLRTSSAPDDTRRHARRVRQLAALIAAALDLPAAEVAMIRRDAPLHDVGKRQIPEAVLLKPGPLTDAEWELMKSHATVGAKVLSYRRSGIMRMVERIALSHHERLDGSGYPEGFAGDQITLCARIVAVADVFDALSSERPYRAAWPEPDVVAEIQRGRGTHFDPAVVDAFLSQYR